MWCRGCRERHQHYKDKKYRDDDAEDEDVDKNSYCDGVNKDESDEDVCDDHD